MTDIEKVIEGLTQCTSVNKQTKCHKCPYWGSNNGFSACDDMKADALELLKEQQAIKPDIDGHSCRCGQCDDFIMSDLQAKVPINRESIRFCAHCGRKIDWKEWEKDGKQDEKGNH